jgi:hypothetical protein
MRKIILCLAITATVLFNSCQNENIVNEQENKTKTSNRELAEGTLVDHTNNYGVPGLILDHSPKSTNQYLGSPSICILPNGDYVASHDIFGKASGGSTSGTTKIYKSSDKGLSWTFIKTLKDQHMSNLFYHKGALYLMGLKHVEGNVVIRKSDDNGLTWTKDAVSILTCKGHTAPTPTVVHDGRIWRAMESADGPGGWPTKFKAFLMSAPENADLLDPNNWIKTNSITYDATKKYLNGAFQGWLEGNAVVGPDNKMKNVLRVHANVESDMSKASERIAIAKVDDENSCTIDRNSFARFPGGAKKFTIRFDPITGKYFTLSNFVPTKYRNAESLNHLRNTIALCYSSDLITWTMASVILTTDDTEYTGFQYVDWQFEDKDIVFLSRTAFKDEFGNAYSAHNNNYITFHRITNFRKRAKLE